MKLCTRRLGCHMLDGHYGQCSEWDTDTKWWRPLGPTDAERRHTEAVRDRENRARRIADSEPLPATWKAGVTMTDALMHEITAYGAACARRALNETEKER